MAAKKQPKSKEILHLTALVRGPKLWFEEAGHFTYTGSNLKRTLAWFDRLLKKYRPLRAELIICSERRRVNVKRPISRSLDNRKNMVK